ncbi:MAG TPA: 3-deoxy-D-manno-octulosonic acid transferase [Parachlamydiaceae bacterium]|nr:3-deoxy-D-manno-octulosonic acid transferase [Parachlamydiaceae bacterium]
MIFSLLYDVSLILLILLYSPKIAYDYFFKGKYQKSLKKRFGIDFPEIDKKNEPLIWFHAVSVGETRAIAALAKALSADYTLLITSITETGYAESKRSLAFADYHLFLPIDLKFIIQPIVFKVKPDVVMVSETDLWYQFLKAAKKEGSSIFLVNGKISERSLKRLNYFSFFANKLYGLVDFFVVQSEAYKERFLSLGVPKEKIGVSGNLKFDIEEKVLSQDELKIWKERFGIDPRQKVITVGSTHENEETLVLDAIDQISGKHPDLKVILVPRHPERFSQIEKELQQRKASFCVFSKSEKCSQNIVLVDAMGLLRYCYQIADIAIVGGSFWPKVGGHNILEPLYTGVPVIFGSYMHSQPELVHLVHAFSAGVQTDKEGLKDTLDVLLRDSEKCLEIKKSGLEMIASLQGSTKRTLEILVDHFQISSQKKKIYF